VTRGPFFESFAPGDLIEHWPGRTVDEGDHRVFCLLTMHPAYSGPEVHPAYLYSLLMGLSVTDLSVHAISHDEPFVHVLAPVREGETIYARSEILSVENVPGRPDRGIVTLMTRGYPRGDRAPFMSIRRRLAIRRSRVDDAPWEPRC
jgi:acyl dehydratase